MESKRSVGRPRSAEPKARALAVRFTEAEEQEVRDAAAGTPLSTWLREAALERARAQRP